MTDKNPPKPEHTLDTEPNITEARRRIQYHVDRYKGFEKHALDMANTEHISSNAHKENVARAKRWRQVYRAMERDLLGLGGCVIASFDERCPKIRAELDAADQGG